MVRVVWVRAPMPRHLVAMAHSTTYGTLRRGGVQSMVERVVVVRRRVLLVVVGRGGLSPSLFPTHWVELQEEGELRQSSYLTRLEAAQIVVE